MWTQNKYTSSCDENIPKDGVLVGVVGAVLARDLQDSGDRRGVVVKNVADLGNKCLYVITFLLIPEIIY